MLSATAEKARAKVNVALHVLGRRLDGYHELDSLVAFADVGDELTFAAAERTSLSINGPYSTGLAADESNLVLKAFAALGQHVALPPVAITLRKNLPVASGIGGGSADAAAALRGLSKMVGARLSAAKLNSIALSLGADVPVCLTGKSCRMQGIGEIISPLAAPPAPAIVLVNPQLPCATADVFRVLGLKAGESFGTACNLAQPESWRNDLQIPAVSVLPVIADVLQALQTQKVLTQVRMSGSGATCFGLAPSLAAAESAADAIRKHSPSWWIEAAELR